MLEVERRLRSVEVDLRGKALTAVGGTDESCEACLGKGGVARDFAPASASGPVNEVGSIPCRDTSFPNESHSGDLVADGFRDHNPLRLMSTDHTSLMPDARCHGIAFRPTTWRITELASTCIRNTLSVVPARYSVFYSTLRL